MAAFVTANRWATGVETHQTSYGRILCTGIGCVGCFPDLFSSEAKELGVCDVELREGILGLRSFLDEKRNFSKKDSKKAKTRKKAQRRATFTKRDDVERDTTKHGDKDATMGMDSVEEERQQSTEFSNSTAASQTKHLDSDIQIRHTEPLPVENINEEEKLVPDEESKFMNKEDKNQDHQRHSMSNDNRVFVEGDECVNERHRNSQIMFDQQLAGSRFEKVHDEIYVVKRKDMALSSLNNYSSAICDDIFLQESEFSFGEDAVCFFFALEYFNSQRILPHFRVMEIVEALSEVVDLKDIKCVQRISHRWHIVLKSRKYIPILRNSGLKLRGRAYKLVDDFAGYFDVVQ